MKVSTARTHKGYTSPIMDGISTYTDYTNEGKVPNVTISIHSVGTSPIRTLCTPKSKDVLYLRDVWTIDDVRTLYKGEVDTIRASLKDNAVEPYTYTTSYGTYDGLTIRHLSVDTRKHPMKYKGSVQYIHVHPDGDKPNLLTEYFVEQTRLGCKNRNFISPQEYIDSPLYEYMKPKNPTYDDYEEYKQYMRMLYSEPPCGGMKPANKVVYECALFPIPVAMGIYSLYWPKSVLDMSAGWGDRLVAASLSGIVTYYGIDPNSNMRPHYDDMIKTYTKKGTTYKVITKAFEDVVPKDVDNRTFDMMLSSPPYFTTEMYSSDPEQAFMRYSTVDTWLNGFMYPSIDIAYNLLNKGGYYIIVLSDTRQGNTEIKYTEKVLSYLDSKGMKYIGCIRYVHGKVVQPIWIYRKTI